ncbi:MAG TPA: DUF4153 domain-containing protein [Allosphingosinicella sp.]|nr:DUF4153 domain-containing protein [Allosphingosinicella sp.]
MSEAEPVDHEPWPLRALLLLGLGAALALTVHLLTRGPAAWQWTENPMRLGAAAALSAGGIVFAFSLERPRWLWSVLFGVASGLVVGFVTYWNGQPDSWGAGEGWQLASALLALVIAVPLFQSSRDAGRWNLDYRVVHAHILTNIVLWILAWGFALLTFLLVLLLSELFRLIGLDLLRDLIDTEWFPWPLFGGALGAAIGLLRDRDHIVGTLQRVATAILSVLAPILAAGLVLFVLALPFTGLQPLWDQTRATTPILLVCVVGAVVLINAVVGSGADEDEARPRIVRWAAAALAAVVLPLAIVAAVSTGKRIAQHGFTPDRLWAAVFVAITVAGAAAYLFAVIRGRAGWPARLRTLNVRIAVGICLVALFLAMPIVSFGAISTRDQLARLQSGRIAADKFDWAALRFDFGPSGRRALERLVRSPNATIRENARTVLAAKSRYDVRRDIEDYVEAPRDLLVFPAGAPVSADLRQFLLGRPGKPGACTGRGECLLYWKPGATTAVALMDRCAVPAVGREAQVQPEHRCLIEPLALERTENGWRYIGGGNPGRMLDSIGAASTATADARAQELAMLKREREALQRGEVEIREVKRRQVFIGGEPKGPEFE